MTSATLERLGLDADHNRMACCARVHGPVTISLTPNREAASALPAAEFPFDPAVRVVPATDLARAAGLEVRRGVVVDEQLRTSDPRIFAVGDAVEWEGEVLKLWPIAVEQRSSPR